MTTTLPPGARIWRGAKGFDTGGTPNVPRYGSTVEDTPSIPGGPVSPAEWAAMTSGAKKLAIRTWATNACRAEGVDEKHWVPYLEKVVSFETGASGISGTGNPNVVNMYDTNAQKNIPSIGLAQVIQDNAPGQNLLDPVTNLRASIRYIRSEYGDVTNIPEAQGIQAGYQTGGRIWHGAKGFDEGGLSSAGDSAADQEFLTLYHRTSKANADSIIENGFDAGQKVLDPNRTVVTRSRVDPNTFFSDKPQGDAAQYGDTTLKVSVPKDLVKRDPNFDTYRGETYYFVRSENLKGLTVEIVAPERDPLKADFTDSMMASALPTQDEIIEEAMEGINERGGITIDLTGHQPSEGYGYAPSKETELMFEAGKITPEDVDAYIDSHFEELQGEGMHFGAWVSEEDSAVYLDVSKVGPADAETLRAAMKAEQLGIWDFGAPPELGELRIGRIDDAGKYIPLGQASDLHAEHAREVQRAIESRSATSTPDVPREPAPEVALEKPSAPTSLEPGPRIWRDGKSGKASVPEILGKAGKVLGPALTAANDALLAYGLVDQAAQQGIADQIAKSNVIKKGPSVLGIPTGTAFSDPTFKNQQSAAGRSPADLQYWLKHGRWPEQDKPLTRSGPTLPGMQGGGQPTGLKLHNGFCIRHADGTTTRHTLTQTGPKNYEADGNIKLLPGDTIEIDGHRTS